MRKFLAIAAVMAMAVGANAQTASPVEIEKVNSGCPIKISDECTLASVTMGEGAVVFVFNVSDATFANLEPMKDILRDTMVAELMSSPDPATQQVVAYCVKSNLGIVQRFTSPQGAAFELMISPADLAN